MTSTVNDLEAFLNTEKVYELVNELRRLKRENLVQGTDEIAKLEQLDISEWLFDKIRKLERMEAKRVFDLLSAEEQEALKAAKANLRALSYNMMWRKFYESQKVATEAVNEMKRVHETMTNTESLSEMRSSMTDFLEETKMARKKLETWNTRAVNLSSAYTYPTMEAVLETHQKLEECIAECTSRVPKMNEITSRAQNTAEKMRVLRCRELAVIAKYRATRNHVELDAELAAIDAAIDAL